MITRVVRVCIDMALIIFGTQKYESLKLPNCGLSFNTLMNEKSLLLPNKDS